MGVTWRIAGIEIGIGSMSAMAVLLISIITAAIGAAVVFGAGGAVVVVGFGIGVLLVALVVISRLVGMGRLSERTQLRLISDAMRRPRYMNFNTPDVAVGINDGIDLFGDASSVYRNF